MPSYYEALPIFRAAMDTAVRVDRAVQRFPKGHKYVLGAKLREASADILVLVARANRRADRQRALALLCDRVEELKLLLQLGKEVQAFQRSPAHLQARAGSPRPGSSRSRTPARRWPERHTQETDPGVLAAGRQSVQRVERQLQQWQHEQQQRDQYQPRALCALRMG